MSITLHPIPFKEVPHEWLETLARKSKNDEPYLRDKVVGIFRNNELQGYFALNPYPDGTLEIQQGYLKPEAQHKHLSRLAMKLLQVEAKKLGFKQIVLQTRRSFRAYNQFMDGLGFKPEVVVYSKTI